MPDADDPSGARPLPSPSPTAEWYESAAPERLLWLSSATSFPRPTRKIRSARSLSERKIDQLVGRRSLAAVHPHIERSIRHQREPALRLGKLIPAHAQVGQQPIHLRHSPLPQRLPQFRKRARAGSGCAPQTPRCCSWPAPATRRRDRSRSRTRWSTCAAIAAGMPAHARRRIAVDPRGLDRQILQRLLEHDRHVHTCPRT